MLCVVLLLLLVFSFSLTHPPDYLDELEQTGCPGLQPTIVVIAKNLD